MRSTTVVVIGAGQAGLAVSRCLHQLGLDHVVLDRADVADAWRNHRWDSLRLLTPTWMSRLPGFSLTGDPEGFLPARVVADQLEGWARSFGAPVTPWTEVIGLRHTEPGWEVHTNRGTWSARAVVVATGNTGTPAVPAVAADLPPRLHQVTSARYRRPEELPEGGCLVVGAAASGVQLAEEIHHSGRPVTLAVGDHVRLPRRYRGRDILAWLEMLGIHDEQPTLADVRRVRRTPSAQLVGSDDRRNLDLGTLRSDGVHPVGRLVGFDGRRLQLSGSFARVCQAADLKMHRLLQRIDDHVVARGLTATVGAPDRPGPTQLPSTATMLDLGDITSVVWATGHRPSYPWLDARLLDRSGGLRHQGGVLAAPGLYAVGLHFGRRRTSHQIDGVGRDAVEVVRLLRGHLDRMPTAA